MQKHKNVIYKHRKYCLTGSFAGINLRFQTGTDFTAKNGQ